MDDINAQPFTFVSVYRGVVFVWVFSFPIFSGGGGGYCYQSAICLKNRWKKTLLSGYLLHDSTWWTFFNKIDFIKSSHRNRVLLYGKVAQSISWSKRDSHKITAVHTGRHTRYVNNQSINKNKQIVGTDNKDQVQDKIWRARHQYKHDMETETINQDIQTKYEDKQQGNKTDKQAMETEQGINKTRYEDRKQCVKTQTSYGDMQQGIKTKKQAMEKCNNALRQTTGKAYKQGRHIFIGHNVIPFSGILIT